MNSTPVRFTSLKSGLHGRLARAALVVALFASATPARADDPDTEVAKRLFREGAALYGAGQYQKALEAFDNARVAKPLPAFDFNIARCLDRLGRWSEALVAYERFAATTTDEADGKEARERIPVLQKRVKEQADRGQREEHYRKATNFFNGAEYLAAVEEFKLAYRSQADPMLLYNIAQAYRLAGDAKSARNYYEQFLHELPKTQLRPAIEQRIAEMKAKVDGKPAPVVAVAARTGIPQATKEAPANEAKTTAPAANPAAGAGSERLNSVAEVIKTNRPGFRACFDAWSKIHPNVPLKVNLSFYLDPDGMVNDANADPKGLDAPDLATCISDHARTLTYPAAPNGKFTRFNYPFDFKPN